MAKVVAIMSMSLDGYVADASDGVAEVFDWYFFGRRRGLHSEQDHGHDVPRLAAERRPPEGFGGRGRGHAHRSTHVRGRRRLGRPAPVGCARFRRHSPRARRLATARLDGPVRHRRHRKRRCSSEIGCRPEVRGSARRPNDPAVPGRRAARRDPHRSGCRVARRGSAASTTSRTHRSSSGIRQSSPVWVSRICAIPCTRRRPPGSCDHESVRMLVAALLTPALLVACTDDGRPAPTRRGRSRSRAGQPLRARRRR